MMIVGTRKELSTMQDFMKNHFPVSSGLVVDLVEL